MADATDDPVDLAMMALGAEGRRDVALGPLTTYRAGGPAAVFVDAENLDGLARVAEAVRRSGLPVLTIGNGSNLLVADRGVRAIVVKLTGVFDKVEIMGTTVRAGGASLLPVVARRTATASLTGFEWAVGVPGSIGGAVRMNAGGHGSDMAASLAGVRVFDLSTGDHGVMTVDDLALGYRRSAIGPAQVVTEAELALRAGVRAVVEAEISEIVRWRRENQPGGANAGSVFTNPPGDSAGRLIDAAGCKGVRRGTAQVSTKHANFIQIDVGGSADDALALMVEVRHRVLAVEGVDLRPETRLVGFDPEALREVEG